MLAMYKSNHSNFDIVLAKFLSYNHTNYNHLQLYRCRFSVACEVASYICAEMKLLICASTPDHNPLIIQFQMTGQVV